MNDWEEVERLLGLGADPNLRDAAGRTAIRIALENGCVDCVAPLLAGGADVSYVDAWGNNMLGYSYACPLDKREDRKRVTAMLRNARVPEDGALKGMLIGAAQDGDVGAVTALLKKGVDPNTFGPSGGLALVIAASWRRAEAAAELIRGGAEVIRANDDGRTPLIAAAADGSIEMVKLLVEAGADVFASTVIEGTRNDALYHAKLQHRSADVIEYLSTLKRQHTRPRALSSQYVKLRGLANTETTAQLIALKLPIDMAGERFVRVVGKAQLRRDVLDQRIVPAERSYLFTQFKGHPWTIIGGLTEATWGDPLQEWAAKLSKALKTPALFYNVSDDPIALRFVLFQNGKPLHELDYAAQGAIQDFEFAAAHGNKAAGERAKALRAADGIIVTTPGQKTPRVRNAAEYADKVFKALDLYVPSIQTARATHGQELFLSFPDVQRQDLERMDMVSIG
jgi:hypothetical protein